MATSFYFNNFKSSQEQNLIEDLVIESIKIYGLDVYYIPRRLVNKDSLLGEDTLSEYNTPYMIEMYVKNVEGFEGEGSFLSKFNLEIRDQITFTVANRTFESEVLRFEQGFVRPREGDLVYFPLNQKVFQIKFVDQKPVFYQLGALQMYDLKCELFEYSNEIFNTGIQEIDNIELVYSNSDRIRTLHTEDDNLLTDESGFSIVKENYNLETTDPLSDNEDIQFESDDIIDFSEKDPFSEGGIY